MNTPSFNGNWVDLLILLFLFVYLLKGLKEGFFVLIADLFSFLASLVLALKFYPLVAKVLIVNFALPHGIANVVGFIFLAIISGALLGLLVRVFLAMIPEKIITIWWTKILGILPAIVDGLIILAFFLTVLVALPISGTVKKGILDSRFGGSLVRGTSGLGNQLNTIFGEALHDSLTFLTIQPGVGETVDLRFRLSAAQLSIDQKAEGQMFNFANQERVKRGLLSLKFDTQIAAVARGHSMDMFERGYFSHTSPDGQDVLQRMVVAGVQFSVVGENIALAPDTLLAHEGLMNSEGHRRNILNTDFSRVGIGVIDGGIYGKMFTQDFAE